jgi:hypothetical protein
VAVRRQHLLVLSSLAAVTFLAAAVSASARAVDDDVLLSVQTRIPGSQDTTPTAGESFKLVFGIDTHAGVVQTVKLTVSLPAGLHWGADGPDPGEGCEGTSPAVCSQKLVSSGVGTVGGGYEWDVIADAPGAYDVPASVEATEPDPNPANNTATYHLVVAAVPPSGGTSGGKATVTAGLAHITPGKPRAGGGVRASVQVSMSGSPVRPTHVACTGRIGGAALHGAAVAAPGSATCRFATPAAARGRILRATIAFSVGGTRITRHASTRLR